MSLENQFKLRRHHDHGGRYVPEGQTLKTKKGFIGIHFHARPLTLDEATDRLRQKNFIARDETVVDLHNCGKDEKGNEGHIAITNLMSEVKRGDFIKEINSFLGLSTTNVPKSPWD